MDASLEKQPRRLGWLDFGKAVGILMVLLVHAQCSLGPVTYYGGMFYMPVFFVTAGYTFRLREGESYGVYLKKKARRLLVPYAAANGFLWLFFWIKDCVLAGNPADLKLHSLFGILYSRNQMYVSGYAGENPVLMDLLNAPLWFLTAMFLVYAWYGFISRSRWKYQLLGAGLVFSWLCCYGSDILLPWSLDEVFFFACFFAMGETLRELEKKGVLEDIRVLAVLAVLFFLSSRMNGSVNLSIGDYGKSMALCMASGYSGSVLTLAIGKWLERICPPLVRVMGWIGQETLLILCLHMFLYMFIRTAAGILGLGEGLAQLLLVAGSAVILTGLGRAVAALQKKIKLPEHTRR